MSDMPTHQNTAVQFNEQRKAQHLARLTHEVNRAYCEMIGDHTHLPWEDAPEWQKASALEGVKKHLNNPKMSPEDSHRSWYDFKKADGWVYGPIKDPVAKEHPCMLPYGDLPITQRMKDYIFAAVVKAADRVWTE
jgi:hypothetical protein